MLKTKESNLEETAKKVLENIRTLCYFGSENYVGLQGTKEKFNLFLAAVDQIILFAKAHCNKKANTTSLNDVPMFQAVGQLNKKDIKYLSLISLTDCHTMISGHKVRLYDFKPLFTARMQKIMAALDLGYIADMPQEQWQYIETLIAAYTSNIEDAVFQKRFKAIVDSSVNIKKFTSEIYPNAIKCLVYGFGNCELLTYLTLIELIRIGDREIGSLPLQTLHLQPISTKGEKLEELNFVAIGKWPEKGCLIICPWFRVKPIFYWQGRLANTPELMSPYESIDVEESESKFKKTFCSLPFVTNILLEFVIKHHEKFLELRRKNLLKIRGNFCNYLGNFISDIDKTKLDELRDMKQEQFIYGDERNPFIIPNNVSGNDTSVPSASFFQPADDQDEPLTKETAESMNSIDAVPKEPMENSNSVVIKESLGEKEDVSGLKVSMSN